MHYNLAKNLYLVGANDTKTPMFENMHPIKNGMAYNSYLLLDKKTVLFDTVDWKVCHDFLENISNVLQERTLDYLVIHHMEPDHSACIEQITSKYPDITIISTEKSFVFMKQFGFNIKNNKIIVQDGDKISFGEHNFVFYTAAMVHWPEVMVSYDETSKTLFSADAFGSFGALFGKVFVDQQDNLDELLPEYRRYYSNIVGKFGAPVQALLKKAATLDINLICPLHGGVIRRDFEYFIEKYNKWSKYESENAGVLIVYATMYGNTEKACNILASKLHDNGILDTKILDVSNTDVSVLIENSFKYSHIVVASVTYNNEIYPLMHNYLYELFALNVQNKTFAVIENGSWAITAGKKIETELSKLKNSSILEEKVSILSAMTNENLLDIEKLANSISVSINKVN